MTSAKKTKRVTSKKTKARLMETAYEMAKGLHKIGVIDTITMREFDALCLPKVKDLSNKEIKKIREREKVSQAVFANLLNTSTSTIQQWERGEKHPRGTSLKLLNLVADQGLKILGYQNQNRATG